MFTSCTLFEPNSVLIGGVPKMKSSRVVVVSGVKFKYMLFRFRAMSSGSDVCTGRNYHPLSNPMVERGIELVPRKALKPLCLAPTIRT